MLVTVKENSFSHVEQMARPCFEQQGKGSIEPVSFQALVQIMRNRLSSFLTCRFDSNEPVFDARVTSDLDA